jgi:hypothetical protein
MSHHNLEFKIYAGEAIRNFIDDLGLLRLQVFREFPYLYEGSLDDERKYIGEYASHKLSALLAVFSDDRLVGFSTGTPLNSGLTIVADAAKLFEAKGYKPSDYYYIGESIVLPEYRSLATFQGLSKRMEAYSLQNQFSAICFLTVWRPIDHPLKPRNYKDLSQLWTFIDYEKMGLSVEYQWQTITGEGHSAMLSNKLVFWHKLLVLP